MNQNRIFCRSIVKILVIFGFLGPAPLALAADQTGQNQGSENLPMVMSPAQNLFAEAWAATGSNAQVIGPHLSQPRYWWPNRQLLDEILFRTAVRSGEIEHVTGFSEDFPEQNLLAWLGIEAISEIVARVENTHPEVAHLFDVPANLIAIAERTPQLRDNAFDPDEGEIGERMIELERLLIFLLYNQRAYLHGVEPSGLRSYPHAGVNSIHERQSGLPFEVEGIDFILRVFLEGYFTASLALDSTGEPNNRVREQWLERWWEIVESAIERNETYFLAHPFRTYHLREPLTSHLDHKDQHESDFDKSMMVNPSQHDRIETFVTYLVESSRSNLFFLADGLSCANLYLSRLGR